MTYCFLSLIKTKQQLKNEDLISILSENNDLNAKSKLRRIYEITKILTALKLIKVVGDSNKLQQE